MRKKRLIFLLCMAAIGIGAVWYGFMPVHYAKTFFFVPLSHHNALFDDLYRLHIQSRALLVRTFTAADKKWRIYVLGVKDKKARLIIIDPNGKIEKESFVYLKDRRIPRYCDAIAVSPSGDRIWVLCRHPDYMDQRIVVYGKRMRCISEWRLKRELDFLWVSGEDTVYGTNVEWEIFCFKIGQEQPKEFRAPFPLWFPFFKEGKFCYIDLLEGKFGEKWIAIITWTPKEGKQIFSRFRGNRLLTQSIYWIDEKGNFYDYNDGSITLKDLLPSWLKEGFFRRILLALGLSDRLIKKPQKTVLIFSPKGEILEAIPLSHVIRPKRGEKLEYGELVKVDDKGIYWEVEKVNEPKEYRIVRIVKKRR